MVGWWNSVRREFLANACEYGIDCRQELLGGQPAQRGVPHPFVTHGADAARHRSGSLMPHSTAATISQCSNAVAIWSRLPGLLRSQCSSFEKPHSDEYVPPHHRSPRARARRACGDLGGFAPGAMVAPEIVIVERLQLLVHRDHARTRGVHGDRLDRSPVDAGGIERSRRAAPAPTCDPRGSASHGPGSSFRRCSGYSAGPDPVRPRCDVDN